MPVVVKAGGGSFHHGLTWHGSAPNTSGTVARMALVSHFVPVETRFHETNVDVNYSRYRRRGDLSLDESFFPVVWDETGYRTPWLAELPPLDYAYAVSRKRAARISISARAAQGSARSAVRSCSRETATQRTGPMAWMSAIRPPPGSSTSISPMSSPGPSVSERPGRSTRTDPTTTRRSSAPRSPARMID